MANIIWTALAGFVLVFLPAISFGQIPAVRGGSVEAARAAAANANRKPDVAGPKLSLSDADTLEAGDEGVLYYGPSVSLGPDIANSSTFRVLQIIDEGNLLIDALGKVWWLEMPTAGIVDDAQLNLQRKVFAYAGTKKYDTAESTMTVHRFRFVRDAEPPADDRVAELRTWKDNTGKYTIEAEFLRFEDGKVVLRKASGYVLRIDPARLSAKDVKWYRDKIKELRATP